MDVSSGYLSRRIYFHPARKPFNGFMRNFHVETLNHLEVKPEPQKPSESCLPFEKDENGFLDNGLDYELNLRVAFRRIGAGLQNLGNTCFLNSVLQCLTYTEPLAAYLESGKHQTSCRTAGFCALCSIQRHVNRALQSTGRTLAPKDLVSNLRCISQKFRNSRQEDAHEYMINLLESMHRCCLPFGMPSESPTAYEKSLVHKIFGGQLRSQVKCMHCSYCSDKFDPFLDLSLEIIKADTVQKALGYFTAKEQLDGGERRYNCQQCKQKVMAVKQLTIYKAPHVLTIHLKRFGSHSTGQKIDKQIQFGSTLDLRSFVTGPYEGDLKYTLYGVLVHAGWNTHSGHYYCFVRTSSGMWYYLDDNRVTQVSERKVLEQKAYMLFYVRDRKNVIPVRSLDVVQKEDLVVNATGNQVQSNGTTVKGRVTNGEMGKRLDVPNYSAAISPGDSSSARLSDGILTYEASLRSNNDQMMLEHSVRCKNSLSKMLSLKRKDAEILDSFQCAYQASTSKNGQRESVVELHELLSQQITNQLSIKGKAFHSKPKHNKKLVRRCHAVSIHLASNMFVGVSLGLQKKKKHKKSKKPCLKRKLNHIQLSCTEHETDIGPSTSVKGDGFVNSQTEGVESNLIKKDAILDNAKDSGSDLLLHVIHEKENDHTNASVGNKSGIQRPRSLQGTLGDASQNEVFTQGSEEINVLAVACWDGLDFPSSEVDNISCEENINIGYVADEWNEEYDRGKRKRIKSARENYGVRNLFQEIATKKDSFKRLRTDKSSSNQTFRTH